MIKMYLVSIININNRNNILRIITYLVIFYEFGLKLMVYSFIVRPKTIYKKIWWVYENNKQY